MKPPSGFARLYGGCAFTRGLSSCTDFNFRNLGTGPWPGGGRSLVPRKALYWEGFASCPNAVEKGVIAVGEKGWSEPTVVVGCRGGGRGAREAVLMNDE